MSTSYYSGLRTTVEDTDNGVNVQLSYGHVSDTPPAAGFTDNTGETYPPVTETWS